MRKEDKASDRVIDLDEYLQKHSIWPDLASGLKPGFYWPRQQKNTHIHRFKLILKSFGCFKPGAKWKICFNTTGNHLWTLWFIEILHIFQLQAWKEKKIKKARSPWLHMRATGRLRKVRLLAPPALHTSSYKKHLTFLVCKAEVVLWVYFSGRYTVAGNKETLK